jgi:hypothetical protein
VGDLNRTELRHRLLRRVVDGHVRYDTAYGGWRGAPGFEIGPSSAACLTAMQNKAGIVRVVGGVSFPSDVARGLLAEWDAQHPNTCEEP